MRGQAPEIAGSALLPIQRRAGLHAGIRPEEPLLYQLQADHVYGGGDAAPRPALLRADQDDRAQRRQADRRYWRTHAWRGPDCLRGGLSQRTTRYADPGLQRPKGTEW